LAQYIIWYVSRDSTIPRVTANPNYIEVGRKASVSNMQFLSDER